MRIRARRMGTAMGVLALAVALAAAVSPAANAQALQKRAITFKDLISMHRLSDPAISPDGKWITYTVATPMLEANRTSHDIWIVSAAGGEPRPLTRGGSDTRARWSPDGKKVAFLSGRDGTRTFSGIGTPADRWPRLRLD